METIITSHFVSCLNSKNPSLKPQFPLSFSNLRPNLTLSQSSVNLQFNGRSTPFSHKGYELGALTSVRASIDGQSNSADDEDRWLLEPVGDGDSRHIGFKVAMPSAFEIVSSEVTVGRVPEKADIVIPVATVSGTHARFEKKGGVLLLTDLDSTNGTFIDEKRLTPGVPSVVPSGRLVTFGDTNLALFRVSKLEPVTKTSDSEPGVELGIEDTSNVVES